MRSILIFSSLFLLGCFSARFDLAFAANGCKHRSFGQESTVCVCNENYCDSLDPIKRSDRGTVQTYSTSRDGDRFARQDIHFGKTSSSSSSSSSSVHKISLLPNSKMQKIMGFGGALTDTTGYNFVQLPQLVRENLIRDYFGDHGLEYSSIRVTIGGSDMSTREYSDDDHNGDDFNLDHFRLQPEDLEYKIPFLHMAQQATPQHRPLKTFGTAWSPPAWMKTNQNLHQGGRIKGEPGGKYYHAYARYLLKFLREYQQRNVTWWGMTVVNEPGNFQYNSLEMSPEEQRDFIKKDLGPELQWEGLDKIQVMIYDRNIPGMKAFAHTVLSDPEAAKYVAGIAYHWYTTSDQNRPELTQIHEEWPNKFILATEASESFGSDSLGVWHVAQHYAQDVIGSLKNYVIGWVDWNLAVDMHGGPSWVNQHRVVAPVIVNADGHEYYKQPAFYVLGHFSKFLPLDSVHFQHTDSSSNHSNYDLIAFQRPDGGRVMVILNVGDQPEDFSIIDPEYGTVNVQVKGQSIKTLVWF